MKFGSEVAVASIYMRLIADVMVPYFNADISMRNSCWWERKPVQCLMLPNIVCEELFCSNKELIAFNESKYGIENVESCMAQILWLIREWKAQAFFCD